jgi:hypothetical protein
MRGPGRHDVGDFGIRGLQQVVDQDPLGGVDDPRLLALLQEGLEFVRLEEILAGHGVPDDPGGDPVRHQAHGLPQGGDKPDPAWQNLGADVLGEADGEGDGDGLGRYLAHQQEHGHHDQDVDPPHILGPEDSQEDGRHVGRGGDVDQLVAAQDGNDEPPGFVEEGVDALRGRVPGIAQLLQVNPAQGEEGGLGTGKDGRPREEDDLKEDANDEFEVTRFHRHRVITCLCTGNPAVGWRSPLGRDSRTLPARRRGGVRLGRNSASIIRVPGPRKG